MFQNVFYMYQNVFNLYHRPLKCGPAAIPLSIAVAGLAGAAADAYTNKRQMQHDEEMFEKQKEFELQKFNLQNEYNTPASQVARYRAANLNPSLMAGAGNIGSGNSNGIGSPSQGANSLHPSQIPEFLNIGNDIANAIPQRENIEANTELTRQNASLSRLNADWLPLERYSAVAKNMADAKKAGIDTKVAEKDLEFQSKSLNDRIEAIKKENFLKDAQKQLTDAQTKLSAAQSALAKEQSKKVRSEGYAILKKLDFEIGLLRNQAYALSASGALDMSKMTTEEAMRDAEKRLTEAYNEATRQMTEFQRSDFNSWWLHYIVPSLGGASSALGNAASLIVLKKFGKKP